MHLFIFFTDPMVDSWFLMGSPGPLIFILIVYLVFVLKIGPAIMANRPGFQLKNTMIWYNAIQVLFSIWLTVLVETFFFNNSH